MKTEIKEKLISVLRTNEDYVINRVESYPLQRILLRVLKKEYPDVNFESLKSGVREVKNGDDKKIVGATGEGWDNMLQYAELDRVDFYLPNLEIKTYDQEGEVKMISPKWSSGYEHPTIGSVIEHYKNDATHGVIADILEEYL